MSGFITIYNTNEEPIDRSLIYSLTQKLKYRGPDQQKVWVDNNIGMGHALFKTTFEAEYENQPATIDNIVWITCSARVDDRENLLRKMEMNKKLDLTKTSDSELILHAYKKWGEHCLDHLLGDFAFVIWDSTKEKLFCARDRFGVRQLYYTQNKKEIIICNSLYTMLKHPKISKRINDKTIGLFLLFGDHMWQDKAITAFSDLTSLPPAHKLIMERGKIKVHKYWNIPSEMPLIRYKKESDYVEHFLEVFRKSIFDRLRFPSVVVSMSGGMDSTSIAAIAKNINNIKIHALTGVFEKVINSDDHIYANIVAKKLNIPIHYISGDNYSLLQNSFATTRPLENETPQYWLDFYKETRTYSRVILTGAAADNLFAYSPAISSFKEENTLKIIKELFKLKKIYGTMPSIGSGLLKTIKSVIKSNQNDDLLPYNYPEYLNADFEEKYNLQNIWKEFSLNQNSIISIRHNNALKSLLYPNWNTDEYALFTEFTLPEQRDPFLDLRMIEFALALPSVPWFFHKHLLRRSMKGFLPIEVINRPKIPLGDLRHELAQQKESIWIKQWKPSEQLSPYINRSKFHDGFFENKDKIQNYMNFRMIHLDFWLKNIKLA